MLALAETRDIPDIERLLVSILQQTAASSTLLPLLLRLHQRSGDDSCLDLASTLASGQEEFRMEQCWEHIETLMYSTLTSHSPSSSLAFLNTFFLNNPRGRERALESTIVNESIVEPFFTMPLPIHVSLLLPLLPSPKSSFCSRLISSSLSPYHCQLLGHSMEHKDSLDTLLGNPRVLQHLFSAVQQSSPPESFVLLRALHAAVSCSSPLLPSLSPLGRSHFQPQERYAFSVTGPFMGRVPHYSTETTGHFRL